MRMLFLAAWFPYLALLPQVSGEPPELIKDAATQDRDSGVVEVRRTVTLGRFEDPISVTIPMEAYVAEIPWGGWVVTEDANDVIEYGADGEFRRTLGRRGEGPGELLSPNAVAVDPTDSTWISDNRGRAVIFGPDGLPARTLLSPDIYQIEGFTESGLPYAFLTKADQSARGMSALRYVQIWSREGERLAQLGPGGFTPGAQGITLNEMTPAQGVVMGDTLAIVPSAWEGWLTYWSASREWVSAPADSVWRVLGLGDTPQSASDGRPVAVSSDGAGGYWVLGVVRRLSKSQEDALVQRAAVPRGETAEVFKRQSAPVLNAVYDGAIIHVTSDGTITGGTSFEEYPWGFAGRSQFYTCTEAEFGLIRIHIWEFNQSRP